MIKKQLEHQIDKKRKGDERRRKENAIPLNKANMPVHYKLEIFNQEKEENDEEIKIDNKSQSITKLKGQKRRKWTAPFDFFKIFTELIQLSLRMQ